MAKMTSSNSKWTLTQTIDQAYPSNSPKTITFNTENKFVDQNIELKTIVPAGSITPVYNSSDAGEITPKINLNNFTPSNYGFTTTQPSGTNGINYLTLDPDADVTSTIHMSATHHVSGGYIGSGTYGIEFDNFSPTILDGQNYYIPIVSASFSGGGVSSSLTKTTTPNNIVEASGTTDYYIDFSVSGTASRAAVKYSNNAGAIAAHSNTTALNADSSNISESSRVYLNAAAATVTASKQATSPTIASAGTVNVSGKTQIGAAPSTSTSDINQYYMVIKATAPATTLDITKTVNIEGYLSTNTQITASAATTAKTGSNYYIPIISGVAAADSSSAAVSLSTTDGSNLGYNISASVNTLSDSEPQSGPYVAVTYSGGGNSKVTTAGWFPTGSLASASTGNKTKYIPLKAATVTPAYANSDLGTYFNTGSSSDYSVSITPNYTADQKGFLNTTSGNGTIGYWKIKTTSITEGTTTVSGSTATRGKATWNTGWITSGQINEATFANTESSGITYVDISATTSAPVLATGGYLYINKGYTDNLKISLAKLVPDFDSTQYPNVATSNQMLNGYVAYDQDGNILTGNIQSKSAETYAASASDRNINAGQYLAGVQKILGITTSNIDAGNIKSGINVKVGDTGSATRIKNVTGTFTSSSTVSSGQTAATANQILYGYSAWVNGAEVKGAIAAGSGITFNENVATAAAGYYGAAATNTMQTAAITIPKVTITSASFSYDSSNSNFTISGSQAAGTPTFTTAGYISATKGTITNNGSELVASVAKVGVGATISGTLTVTPAISKIATASGNNATNITAVVSDATPTKPTSGYYVAVQSAAKSTTITATPAVTSAGYGTTTSGQYTATNATESVGAGASSVTYLPITAATAEVQINSNSVTNSAAVSTSNYVTTNANTNNGIAITATGSGTVSGTAIVKINQAGYVPTGTLGSNTSLSASATAATDTTYITGINVPQDVPFTLTTVADTALDATSDITVTNSKYRNMALTNSGKLTITNDNATSGNTSSIIVNALPSSGSSRTGEKTIVNNGRWVTNTVTAGTHSATTYYGCVIVNAVSAAAISSEGRVTTAPSVTIGGNTNMTTASSGTYYFTRTGTPVNGTVQTTWKNATAGYAAANTAGTDDGAVTVTPTTSSAETVYIPTASITASGGSFSGGNTYNGNIITDTTDVYSNGLSIAGSASMTAITYTNTAGYIPAHTDAQSFVDSDAWSETKYLKGVKLTTPSSGKRCFDITVPNGDASTFITFHFEVDSSSNVTVTDTHTS